MSEKLKHKQQAGQNNQSGNQSNVVAMPSKCGCEGCGKKSELMNLCQEHYSWLKFGLITKEGKRPTDFDKKYTSYMKHKNAA